MLGDGAGAFGNPPCLQIAVCGAYYRLYIYAVMPIKPFVLNGHEGLLDMLWDSGQKDRDPVYFAVKFLHRRPVFPVNKRSLLIGSYGGLSAVKAGQNIVGIIVSAN
ncbi:MAG: hypothetical protein BWY65_02275 [Firmicutes bacterium ADurb.Bin373]|nr:MAG: hypothetical protein BWY65_02275 [Firmicutes bacterium ADurb.Bin373]